VSSVIKPATKRHSKKLVAAARDFVLDAYDTAASLLSSRETDDLIAQLREDLDLRQCVATPPDARKIPRRSRRTA
jgi:hypothetical protein